MEYTPEQWARMRDNAVRAAFEMQKRAQVQGHVTPPPIKKNVQKNSELPQFYQAAYNVERFTPKPPTAPVQSRPEQQQPISLPKPVPPPAAAVNTKEKPVVKPPEAKPYTPAKPKSRSAPVSRYDDTHFLLALIMLLSQEGADSMLIAMLMYILL